MFAALWQEWRLGGKDVRRYSVGMFDVMCLAVIRIFARGIMRGSLGRFSVALFAAIIMGGHQPARAQDRLDAHRRLSAEFDIVLKRDGSDAALAQAQRVVEAAAKLAAADPRRADALELVVRAQLARAAWTEALLLADQLTGLRRREAQPELLALALGNQGLALFGAGRSAAAEKVFEEQLDIWRKAFGAKDLRFAAKLDLQAEHYYAPMGRHRRAVEQYQEALAIRDAAAPSGYEKTAEILQKLALVQIALGDADSADPSLDKAEERLTAAVASKPDDDSLKAGLVQLRVLRAGLETKRSRHERATDALRRAAAIKIRDRDIDAEGRVLIAVATSNAREAQGDIAGATARMFDAIDIVLKAPKLTHLVPDLFEQIGALYLADNRVTDARRVLLDALRQQGGEDRAGASLLFQLSEVARADGKAAEQKRLYQRALQTRKETATEVSLFFATNRAQLAGRRIGAYGTERAALLSYGDAVIAVPGGQFAPEASVAAYQRSPVQVGLATSAAHLSIAQIAVVSPSASADAVKRKLASARLYPNAVLVFVHGYNTSFDDALRRGGQLVRDLNFDGPTFVFSWPSLGAMHRYGTDRDNAAASVASFATFLGEVTRAAGTARVHVIAHSMGNRVVLPALVTLAPDARGRLGEVVFAAPAIDVDAFRRHLDVLSADGPRRFTLYASSHDRALQAGYIREYGTTLAGYVAAAEPVLHRALDSIDVSEAGNVAKASDFNHDIFATNPAVTEDIRQLLQRGVRPPGDRLPNLKERRTGSGDVFWVYRRPQPQP